MPIPSYTLGYPQDGSSLGQSKATIRNNLDGTFQTLAVDHVSNNGPNMQPAGYHTVAHFVPQGTNPPAVTGYGQLFSKTINSFTTDQALFWETGAGLIQQLTVNLTPSATTNGYTFLPGGLIFQWGIVNFPPRNGTVTFATANISFPGNCFNVLTTMIGNSSGGNDVGVFSVTKTAFQWTFTGSSSSSYTGFYWTAIGN
jgi:hypothetical protein